MMFASRVFAFCGIILVHSDKSAILSWEEGDFMLQARHVQNGSHGYTNVDNSTSMVARKKSASENPGRYRLYVTRVACENPGHPTFPECVGPEEGTCNGRVRLGYGSNWSAWKHIDGGFSCTNNFFGGDPFKGQAKECVCEVNIPSTRVACENPGHPTFPECVGPEQGHCNGRVRLGYGSKWSAWKYLDGGFSCTNTFFGGDPFKGQAKECMCEATLPVARVACENPEHPTFPECVSPEQGHCDGRVRLGYGSKWSAWKDLNGSFSCTNNFFGGDPFKGQAKECMCEATHPATRVACENPGHPTFQGCESPEQGHCNGRARLGYGSKWSAWKDLDGSFSCTNTFFGGDPFKGQAKECVCESKIPDS